MTWKWASRIQYLKQTSRVQAGPPSAATVLYSSRERTHTLEEKKGKNCSRLHSSLLIPPDWAHLTLRQRNCKSQTRPAVPTSVCTSPPTAPASASASVHPSILLPSTSSRTFPPNAHTAEITVESNEGQKKVPRALTSRISFSNCRKINLSWLHDRQYTAFPTTYSGSGQR